MSLQALAAKIAKDLAAVAKAAPPELSQKSQQSLSQGREPRFSRLPGTKAGAHAIAAADTGTIAGIATIAIAEAGSPKIDLALPSPFADAERLKRAALAFRDSPFAGQAEALGWDEVSLYGVHSGPRPKERLETWGLVPLLAWSVLGLTLAKIEADAATLASPWGSLLRRPRKAPTAEAVPFWAHPNAPAEGWTA